MEYMRTMINIPKLLEDRIKYYENKLQGNEKLCKLYRNCCLSTIETALEQCDDDTGYLHEGFNADDPNKYTRECFTWPNSLFAELVEKCVDEGIF